MRPDFDADGIGRLFEQTAVSPSRSVDPARLRVTARRQSLRRRTLSVVVGTLAALTGVAVWQLPAPVPVIEAITPSHDDAQVALTAGDPEHALLLLHDGTLVADELATGERTKLASAVHENSVAIDLAVSVGSTLEHFTAVAYDDGAGPTGFLTYARRNGGPVQITFTERERWPGNISNRGYRTISPDGRWLAYSGVRGTDDDTLTTYLVPLDAERAEPVLDHAVVLDEGVSPVEWTGPVTELGDRSRLTGRRGDHFSQLVLERTREGFDVVDVAPLVASADDDERTTMHQLAFASQRPGSDQDPMFEFTDRRGDVTVGEPPGVDRAVVAYARPGDDGATIEFALGYGTGNLDFAARGGTALVVADAVRDDPTAEPTDGRAFVLHLQTDANGRITFGEPTRLADGPISGALLGGLDRSPEALAATEAPALPFGWTDMVVADARIAVPPKWAIQLQHPDDPVCANAARTITVIDPTAAPTGARGCTLNLPGGPAIIAVPLSVELSERLEGIAELSGQPATIGGVTGERLDVPTDAEDDDGNGWIDAAYRSRELDLLVVFAHADRFPGLADDVLATLAPADQDRADAPSSIAPFPTDTALTAPQELASEHDGALLADILITRPWDNDIDAPDKEGDWPPPFAPTDAADRHLVVTALAEATWGSRFAGTDFTGAGTVVSLVGATDQDRRWLRDELATQTSLADMDFTIEAVERPLAQLTAMADVVTEALPDGLADEVDVRVEVETNTVVVSSSSGATADRARHVLRHAPRWVEIREGDRASGRPIG